MLEEEHQVSFHIMLLAVFTGLCLLLDVVIAVSRWGSIAIGFISGAVAVCWFVHFGKVGSGRQRLYLYVFIMLVILGYYAYQEGSITDVPIVLCLLIIVLSRNHEKRLIYIVAGSYLVYLLENVFITHYLRWGIEQIVISRIMLGIACLFGAAFISAYFMRQKDKTDVRLVQIEKQLAMAQKENELFLSNMSHELRTPINAVNGVSELLLNSNLPPEVEKEVLVIKSAGRRLYRQISDVLDFSEIQTGHFALLKENYEPLSVVNDALNIVFEGYEEKSLDFAVDVECELPKLLYGDAVRMRKLLVCLMDNAVKFTDQGGGYIYISKRDEQYGINLNIDIWDTGCGIIMEKQEKLFNGSYLGDNSAERKKGGLGLGLSIAHGIVTAMNGFISVHSTPESGTHVHVSIPQEVKNTEPSISIGHVEQYKILCYFNREKYVQEEVGRYYMNMLEHIRSSFHMEVLVASTLDEVMEAYRSGDITHMYVAVWEYQMNPSFFEQAAQKVSVCVFADHGFSLPEGSKVDRIEKPVFLLAVLKHLSRTLPGASGDMKWRSEAARRKDGRKRALIVDDDEMNLVVAKGILERLGVSAEVCGSGKMAIEKCSITDYDIIFMDYMMPQMDGIKAMKRIRELRNGHYRTKPMVVLTANAVSGAKETFLREGFNEFVPKPIEIKELKKILKKYLEDDQK